MGNRGNRGDRGNRLRAAALGLLLAMALAGCISVPSGGPVLSYSVTQGPGGQNQPNPQAVAQPPRANWTPEEIVTGFLSASASFDAGQKTAREYLTTRANRAWTPNWSAVVYSNGPNVGQAVYHGTGAGRTATVTIGGITQAQLSGTGGYAVPSASAGGPPGGPPTFTLQKVGGQWRISNAPPDLLLTSYAFQYDYQLRNLYFFDPTGSYLVPDPVYVPLQATTANLMDGLVYDLIHPPVDWLSRGATTSAFPPQTKTLGDVTLNGGTAAVNLGGAITKKVTDQLLQEVSAQLLWTLTGSGESGPAVQSVELSINGKAWSPPGSDQNPIQQRRQSKYTPAAGTSSEYYYIDGAGDLMSADTSPQGKTLRLAHLGTGYTHLAVSPDKDYVAAVRAGSLFTGRIGGALVRRSGTGYTSVSWGPGDDLWATTGGQVIMLSGAANPNQPLGKPLPVNVLNPDGRTQNFASFSAIRVAPDGVRVAIIVGSTDLDFGAIVYPPSARPTQAAVEIVLSPFSVSVPTSTFTSVTWYGSDDVIALSDPGPALTEYPVDGGTSTSIPAQPQMSWITASFGSPLIANLPRGAMMANSTLSGPWTKVTGAGASAVYPG
jgi:Lipoprotein LpqB beta-propeller domain/Sporulation and spore germination